MEQHTAFQRLNESIRELAEGLDTETLEFFCECPDVECNASVPLRLLEFDARRAASPPVPIVAAHEDEQSAVHGARRRASRGEIADLNAPSAKRLRERAT